MGVLGNCTNHLRPFLSPVLLCFLNLKSPFLLVFSLLQNRDVKITKVLKNRIKIRKVDEFLGDTVFSHYICARIYR